MNERTIILVRHGEPIVDERNPASAWPLSDEGTRSARELAACLRAYDPSRVVTSAERKAIETGQTIAETLGIELRSDAALNEQGLDSVPYLPDRVAFLARVRDHFRFPWQAILGNEPATDAANRLTAAVSRHALTDESPVILISHGRVLAGYLARLSGDDPWTIWQSLTMPDAYLAELDPLGRVARIGGE